MTFIWQKNKENLPATQRLKINERCLMSRQLPIAVLLVFLSLQGAFWYHTHTRLPEMNIVPDVPGEATLKALSFGDEQALFRILALNIQNAGDTFGRFTALYKYDFNRLYHWFKALDGLDKQSNYVPAMATYYFSQTQYAPDVKYIVDYLERFADSRVKEKWWWMVQAVYLADHKLKDSDRALKIANKLAGQTNIPIWAQQMPAFILEKRGEFDAAGAIIQNIMDSEQSLPQGELNFMRHFVDERIQALDKIKAEFDATKREEALRARGIKPKLLPQQPPPDVGAAQAPM